MTENEWLTSGYAQAMLSHINGKVSDRKRRLFAYACCQKIWSRMEYEEIRQAVKTAEKFADGLASMEELEKDYFAALSVVESKDFRPINGPAHWAAYWTAHWAAESAAIWASEWSAESEAEDADDETAYWTAQNIQAHILRDIVGNPFKPITFQTQWKTHTILPLAQSMYDDRDFTAMPILGDALEEAGCDNEEILRHCRSEGLHYRGCWVLDLVLGKE